MFASYFPGLVRLQEVLKLAQGATHKVTVRKLAAHSSGYITMFKDLKAKNEYQIVIDCHSSKVKSVLHEVSKTRAQSYNASSKPRSTFS